jgi:hypothetical protein
VAKALFLCKRARPDIQQAISVLCTRVRDLNQADWEKLMRVMKYLNGTKGENLTLSADDLRVVKWYVDASFAVHPDFESHTSTMMTLGKGANREKAKNECAKQHRRGTSCSRRRSHNDFVDGTILGSTRIQCGKEHCLSRQ